MTEGPALAKPVMSLAGKSDGAYSDDNRVMGTYLHGLFDLPEASKALLKWAGFNIQEAINLDNMREVGIDLIADALEENFDFELLQEALDLFERDKN